MTDKLDRQFDLTLIENTDRLKRRYAGLSTQGTYRAAPSLNLGATYTLSRTWGNFDGEGANGPAPDGSLQYPEYKQAAWNYPEGDLSIDQRHRARIWATYGVPQNLRSDGQRPPDAGNRRPLRRRGDNRARPADVRDQPRLPVAADQP